MVNTVRRTSYAGAAAPPEPTLPAGQHANLQLYNQNLPAGGTMALDSGNFFFLLSAAAVVNVLIMYANGATEIMQSLPVGAQIKRVKPWTRLQITGTGNSNVQFWHGYQFSREDQTNFQSTIATITGAVGTIPGIGLSTNPVNHADVNVAAGTLDNTITANPLRRSLIVGSLSSNVPATTNLRLQGGAGVAAVQGIELQPGTWISLPEAAEMSVYNGDANAQKYYWLELV